MKHICSPLVCDYDKLKRENALMRRWLIMAFVAEQFVRAHKEIERKMPGLFAGGKKGK